MTNETLEKEYSANTERNKSYESALSDWRNDSKELFENAEDTAFMQNAFDSAHNPEKYKTKEIW